MAENRPHGRERNETGSASVFKRGEGLGTGPAGSSFRPGNNNGGSRNRGPGSLVTLLVIIAMVNFGGKSGLSALLSGDTGSSSSYPSGWTYGNDQISNSGNYSVSTIRDEKPDYTVSSLAREKYTDTADAKNATVLVYMCGADLESRSGMATKDIQEMVKAEHGDNVKIILETGGASRWQNSVISADTIQRWRVVDNGLEPLDEDVGNASMTDPETLRDFVDWGLHNYRSDRNILVLWDHGGGSVSGYGHDEKFPNGSMRIDQIAQAWSSAKGSLDFIGFDACLMATLETAIALEPYSDYLIASEEVEPGTGWYYTDWLSQLTKDPSISTVNLGKTIIDTYTEQSSGSTTLSLTDLAELHGTIGEPLQKFSKKLQSDIQSDNAAKVADARAQAKEFARSNNLDQVDLSDFARKLDTEEGTELQKVIKSAVKYNQTRDISNAYGLSVYFPYRNKKLAGRMTSINQNIDMDSDYNKAIRSFATVSAGADAVTSYGSNSIFDLLGGSMPSNGNSINADTILNIIGNTDLSQLVGGAGGLDTNSLDLLSTILGRSMLPSDALSFTEVNGKKVLKLSEDEWKDIHEINLNVWIDDGSGYIDLGYDNIYDFDDEGNLIIDYDGDWIAIDNHPAAVYTTDTEYGDNGAYTFHSYIPAMLNGERVRILIEYSNEYEKGRILGAEKVYENGTDAKGLIELKAGDKVDLLCDYYDYSGNYQDSYYLGDEFTLGDSVQLSDVKLTNQSYQYGYALKDTWNTTRYTQFIRS